MRSSDRGQASTEYVALLAFLAVVLGAAATALAAPDLPGAVARHLRVALCIVGGDVCRDADARALGLEPCVRRQEAHDQQDTLTFVLGAGDRRHWSLTERSDGTWLLTAALGRMLQASADLVRARAGTLVDGGIGASVDGHWLSGSAWELTADQARAVVARTNGRAAGLADDFSAAYFGLPEPTYRYTEGGVTGGLEAALRVGDGRASTDVDLAGAAGDLVLGRRRGPGGDVWYFRTSHAVESALDGLGLPPAQRVAEYRVGPPPTLVLRGTARHGDEETEHVLTLLLGRPEPRRTVQEALLGSGAGDDLLEVLRRDGLRERRTYRLEHEDGGVAFKVLGIGFEHETFSLRRRLTAAELLVGARKVQRADCLGPG